jgi:hypothetical protein
VRRNDPLQWDALIVESGASPVPLEDAEFRRWMSGRRVFVSSTMDDQMRPDRDAARAVISRWGAEPIMWETVTPRDQHPERSYLEGVERSDLYVLLLGARYGVPDTTGYSPTHKEGNRAKELGLSRLLFVRGDVADRDRDGKVNDWLRGLYNEVSGAQYTTPEELAGLLEARLREIAAQQESLWLKLGPLVFPGHFAARRGGRGAEYTVTARVRDGRVRRALLELGGPMAQTRADRLTVGTESYPVRVDEVRTEVSRTSESAVTIGCSHPGEGGVRYAGPGYAGLGITHMNVNGRAFGPADQLELWAKAAVFGEVSQSDRRGGMNAEAMFTHRAQGWLAEGLTQLFLVEHIAAVRGAHVEQLAVGPATATGVRVNGRVAVPDGARPAAIAGVIPLA